MGQRFAPLLLAMLTFVGFACQTCASQEPTPHSILDRALKAGGGVAKISQFKAVSFKGQCSQGNEKFNVSGLFAGPTLFRMEVEYKEDARGVFVGGGDTFWVKFGKAAAKEYHKGSDQMMVETMFRLCYAISLPDQLVTLKGKDYQLTIIGDQAVNGVQAVGLRVNHKLHPETLIYFAKETGLPVKTQLQLPPGTEPVEVFFDNYKAISGVAHFTRLKLRTADKSIEIELRELQLLKKVDSGTFKKPE